MQLQLSAKELAQLLGVSEVTIYKREASRNPLRTEYWLALDYIANTAGLAIMPAEMEKQHAEPAVPGTPERTTRRKPATRESIDQAEDL